MVDNDIMRHIHNNILFGYKDICLRSPFFPWLLVYLPVSFYHLGTYEQNDGLSGHIIRTK